MKKPYIILVKYNLRGKFMKKAILLICAMLTVPAAYAYIQEFTSSDIKTLQGTGYSQEALEIVDTARMLRQATDKDYVPYYSRKIYSDNPKLKIYQIVKRYFDPAQDEHVFGVREIHYNNGWFDLSPSYNEKVTPNDRYKRLTDEEIERLETAGKIIPGSGGVEEGPYRPTDQGVRKDSPNPDENL